MEVTEIPSQYWLAGYKKGYEEMVNQLLTVIRTQVVVTSALNEQFAAKYPFEHSKVLLSQANPGRTFEERTDFGNGVASAVDAFRKAIGAGDGSQGSRV